MDKQGHITCVTQSHSKGEFECYEHLNARALCSPCIQTLPADQRNPKLQLEVASHGNGTEGAEGSRAAGMYQNGSNSSLIHRYRCLRNRVCMFWLLCNKHFFSDGLRITHAQQARLILPQTMTGQQLSGDRAKLLLRNTCRRFFKSQAYFVGSPSHNAIYSRSY